jgi:enediyne polyketide synthase
MNWIEPLLGPYLERRLAELVPGTCASVAVGCDSGSGIADCGFSRARSDRTIAAALGYPAMIHRRPDGKPVAVCDEAVSVAHAGRLTLSIVSARGVVACDAEPVAHRSAREWRDLLGTERDALAGFLTKQSSAEEFDVTATRLWCADECLKKAGLSRQTPLVFRATTPDHWVMLAAGTATIATWVGAMRGQPGPLAIGLLVGSDDEVL